MFGTLQLSALAAVGIVLYFVYGWGMTIIQNYSDMAMKIERLERDKNLIESRVASYQTLLARRDAAIEASKCKEQIQRWIKNPDTIPGFRNPFEGNTGG
jgi:hypothetical protein